MKNHENRKQIYTCIKKFYLNDEELEILNNKVSKSFLGRSEFLRTLMRGKCIREREPEDVRDLIFTCMRIANLTGLFSFGVSGKSADKLEEFSKEIYEKVVDPDEDFKRKSKSEREAK